MEDKEIVKTYTYFNEERIRKSRVFKLVKKARLSAIEKLNDFLLSINVDTKIIDEIKTIEIYLDDHSMESDEAAVYNHVNHDIHIDYWYLEEIFKKFKSQKLFVAFISSLLIHEYFHSFRDFNLKYLKESNKNTKESIEYDELYMKFHNDIEVQDKKYKKVLSIIEKDDQYLSIVYDYEDGTFQKYLIPKDKIENKKDLFYSIGYLINNAYSIYEETHYLIYPYKKLYPSEHDRYGRDGKIVTSVYNAADYNYDVTKYLGIEEAFSESFSNIIECFENGKSIKTIINKLLKNDEFTNEVKLALLALSNMPIEDIRWFFTSYMYDTFEYRIEHLYGDKFNEVLYYFNYFYDMVDSYDDPEYKSKKNKELFEKASSLILKQK